MTPARQLLVWSAVTAMAVAIGASYSALTNGDLNVGATIGGLVGAMILGFEIFILQRSIGAPLRRLPFLVLIVLSSAVWLALIYVGLQLGPALHGLNAYGDEYQATTFPQDMAFAYGVAFLMNAALRVRSLVGARVFFNFLLGRYYRPLREERIFMFLDLNDSTKLAEKLGDIGVQALLRQFFFDVSEPVVRFGGETHRYIGDEVVVTWPLHHDQRDQRCIDCVMAIRALIERRSSFYMQRFGVVPEFRVGMHGGSVVASEIGEDKREIVYFGDTINTAARLGAACKTTGSSFLISAALATEIGLPQTVTATAVDPLWLSGKEAPFEALALKLAVNEAA